jgi:AraC-like DNA-binding protein
MWIRIQYFSRVRKVVEYIDQHPDEPITLDQIATIGCMERTAFSKLFKAKIGITLRDFLQAYRISKAISEMKASDLSITEIAYAVGFSSLPTFERAFKKVTGQAPSKYRAMLMQKNGLLATTEGNEKPANGKGRIASSNTGANGNDRNRDIDNLESRTG